MRTPEIMGHSPQEIAGDLGGRGEALITPEGAQCRGSPQPANIVCGHCITCFALCRLAQVHGEPI